MIYIYDQLQSIAPNDLDCDLSLNTHKLAEYVNLMLIEVYLYNTVSFSLLNNFPKIFLYIFGYRNIVAFQLFITSTVMLNLLIHFHLFQTFIIQLLLGGLIVDIVTHFGPKMNLLKMTRTLYAYM